MRLKPETEISTEEHRETEQDSQREIDPARPDTPKIDKHPHATCARTHTHTHTRTPKCRILTQEEQLASVRAANQPTYQDPASSGCTPSAFVFLGSLLVILSFLLWRYWPRTPTSPPEYPGISRRQGGGKFSDDEKDSLRDQKGDKWSDDDELLLDGEQ